MRLAIITHAFPPSRHANGKRPYYLAKGFLDAGWEVDVFTSPLGCDLEIKEILTSKGGRVIRVSDPVVKILDRFKSVSFLYRLSISLVNGLMWPDFYTIWSRRVMRKMKKEGEYDRVLAFIFPPSVYLNAKKGVVNKHWTFDLQESVTPQYQIVPRRSPFQRWRLPQLVKLERKALHQAGHVVYTANTNRQAYLKEGLVAKAHAEHIPYFFDAKVFEKESINPSNVFEIRYFGAFDWRGSRTPRVFLYALSQFLERHPEARSQTKFVFYGMWLSEHDKYIQDLGLEDVVEIRDAVPYDQYLEKVKSAPVLLLVVSAEHNLFMPSKIVDYLGAKRPILAFVPPQSEMKQVLVDAGMAGQAVDETDVNAGAIAIASLWLKYKMNKLGDLISNTDFWSSKVQIPRYLKIVEEVKEKVES